MRNLLTTVFPSASASLQVHDDSRFRVLATRAPEVLLRRSPDRLVPQALASTGPQHTVDTGPESRSRPHGLPIELRERRACLVCLQNCELPGLDALKAHAGLFSSYAALLVIRCQRKSERGYK